MLGGAKSPPSLCPVGLVGGERDFPTHLLSGACRGDDKTQRAGSSVADGMTASQLDEHLQHRWQTLKDKQHPALKQMVADEGASHGQAISKLQGLERVARKSRLVTGLAPMERRAGFAPIGWVCGSCGVHW